MQEDNQRNYEQISDRSGARYLSVAVAAGLVLLASVVVFKRYLPYTGRSLMPEEPPAVVLAMDNVHLVGMSRARKLWSADAGKVEIGRNKSIATVTDIHDGEIYQNDEVALRVKAGRARYDSRGGILQFANGILMEGTQGEKVAADSATWDTARSRLESSGKVNIELRGVRASTSKLLVDFNNKEVSMWDVRMAFDVEDLQNRSGQEAGRDGKPGGEHREKSNGNRSQN